MQCVERGLLSLDDPIGTVLPEWAEPKILAGFDEEEKPILKKATKPLTLRHLLTHSSGLGYPAFNPLLLKYVKSTGGSPSFMQKGIQEDFALPLLFEPGEGWEYGCSLDWAGKMVEQVNGGVRLGEYMATNIWEPLGMTLTSFQPGKHPDVAERLVGRPMRMPDGTLIPDAPPESGLFPTGEPKDDYGGGGLFSCAQDYIKLVSSLLLDDGKLLKSDTVEDLCRPQLEDPKYIQAVLDVPEVAKFFAPSFGPEVKWNHGLGGAIALDGVKDRAEKGMLYWAGLPNSFWVS
jgi:CubicO group peptidase (beta-lactamase class C family)